MTLQVEGENLRKVEGELLRYIVAAGTGAALDLGVFSLLVKVLEVPYLAANPIAWFAGVVYGYWLCVRWVFPYRRVRNLLVEFLLFCLIGLGGMLISTGTLWLCVELAGLDEVVAKVAATGTQFVFNFTVRKLALFSRVQLQPGAPDA